jgi:hypothetical protein
MVLPRVIAMMRPDESWVGKWQRIGNIDFVWITTHDILDPLTDFNQQINLHVEYMPYECLGGYQMMWRTS